MGDSVVALSQKDSAIAQNVPDYNAPGWKEPVGLIHCRHQKRGDSKSESLLRVDV